MYRGENEIVEWETLYYCRGMRDRFRSGELPEKWSRNYPEIFDSDDLRLLEKQPNLHFFEWLGAVVIWKMIGYFSLVEKYEFGRHARKTEVVHRLLPRNMLPLLKEPQAQCPDLLVYSTDYSDWFFCEVKGEKDRIQGNQNRYFRQLNRASQKPVRVLYFRGI